MTIACAASMFPANIVWRFRPKYLIKGEEHGETKWWRKKFYRFDFFGRYFKNKNVLAVLTDSPDSYRRYGQVRVIEVCSIGSEFVDCAEADFQWPYLAHPKFLFNAIDAGNYWPGRPDMHSKRHYRVCFAGNCDPSHYRFSENLEQLGVMSRVCSKEIIERVFESEILKIEAWSDKEKLASPHQKSIVLSNSFKAGLNFIEYCQLLRESNFFLALPGIGSPFTHSLYESLLCGCIPILPESPVTATDWVDRQNCLLFNDAESLIAAIDLALNVDVEYLRSLRAGAQEVFKDSYEIESLASRLLRSECRRMIFRRV